MESVLTTLASGKLSTCATITLMFTYTILLDRDFACTCKPQHSQCSMYQYLPFLIILVLILWTDRSFQRVCRYLCLYGCSDWCHTSSFLLSLVHHTLKAALVALLWVAFVFIDGDWYVCCYNDHSEEQAPLACKAEGKFTEKEQVTIAELKNKSRVIGGWLLFAIVLVASLMPFCVRGKCCGETFSSIKSLYSKLILEEEENVLNDILRKSAKDKLTVEIQNRIRGEQWEKCFDVAEELIKKSTEPTISTRTQETESQARTLTSDGREEVLDLNRRNESADVAQNDDPLSVTAM